MQFHCYPWSQFKINKETRRFPTIFYEQIQENKRQYQFIQCNCIILSKRDINLIFWLHCIKIFFNQLTERCEYQPTAATAGVCFLSKGIDGPCAENHFFVPSRSIVSIKCNDKFKLNKDGNEQMEGTSKDVTCIRGKFLDDIKCIPGT